MINTTAMTRNSATSVSLEKFSEKSGEGDKPDADAQRLDLGNEHGGDIGADDRAHAANNHHDEGIGDYRQIHAKIGGLAGELQRTAETGKQ